MCMIRIPFQSRAEDGAPLQRCLDHAAEESGVDIVNVARVMTFLLEAIADEVVRGRSVRLPGFGVFAPAPMPERHRKMSRDLTPRCKPVFLAARGFRAQVAHGALPSQLEARRLARFEKNHADHRYGDSARVFTAMAAMRQQISAQLAGARD